ncbi:Hypothetical predicted protein, partial [Paramuricea clavata]
FQLKLSFRSKLYSIDKLPNRFVWRNMSGEKSGFLTRIAGRILPEGLYKYVRNNTVDNILTHPTLVVQLTQSLLRYYILYMHRNLNLPSVPKHLQLKQNAASFNVDTGNSISGSMISINGAKENMNPMSKSKEMLEIKIIFPPWRRHCVAVVRNFSGSHTSTNVIYKIPCKDCPWNYIGETGRSLKTRKSEHVRNVKQNKDGSNIAKHAWDCDHKVSYEYVRFRFTYEYTHFICILIAIRKWTLTFKVHTSLHMACWQLHKMYIFILNRMNVHVLRRSIGGGAQS